MSTLFNVLCGAVIASCIAINVFILLQKKKSAGLSGGIAGMGASDTYWDKNKGRSLEGSLEKYTKLAGAAFILLSLAINLIK